jgi:hypothetical protein
MTDGQSASLSWNKHPSGAYDQIFITVRQLRVCWCGALSLTRRWVCRLQLLLTLASTVIFWSESRGTRDHILLSQIRDFPFLRLLRLAGLRWRDSFPSASQSESQSQSYIATDGRSISKSWCRASLQPSSLYNLGKGRKEKPSPIAPVLLRVDSPTISLLSLLLKRVLVAFT